MATLKEIISHVELLTRHPLNADEGVQHGKSNRSLSGVTVSWMASPEAIQSTGKAGHDLLIAHESLYYPYNVINSTNPPEDWKEWKVNRQRMQLLNQYGLSFLRLHGAADEICIFDTFAELLGLGKPVFVDGLVKVYEIPSCPLNELIQKVKERVGMPSVRVSVGDMERPVRRVGLPWGGLGLFVNVGYQQSLIAQGCDVFIAGESDNYGFRFSSECGVPMIETSHELSENPGLRRFTEILARAFPAVEFRFYENECIWQVR